MRRFTTRAFATAIPVLLGATSAAFAGTVYVPVPGVTAIGNAGYQLVVTASNPTNHAIEVSTLTFTSGSDGTRREGRTPSKQSVAPGRTVVFTLPGTDRGLAELTADTGLEFAARLVGTTSDHLGFELPVISSENMGKPSEVQVVQGLQGSATTISDVVIVNLGQQATSCSANLRRADGTSIINAVSLPFQPLSSVFYTNVFSGAAVADARVEVSCQQNFFAYAQMKDATTGEFAISTPTAGSNSSLTAPGSGGPGPTAGCPAGATCANMDGHLSTATNAQPYHRLTMPGLPGTWRRSVMTVDIKFGPWGNPPNSKWMAYYFAVNGNRHILGCFIMRGPEGGLALMLSGWASLQEDKDRVKSTHHLSPGQTYHFITEYNAGARKITITVKNEAGTVVDTWSGPTNVSSFTINSGDNFLLDMGGVAPEFKTMVGTEWSNWHVELYH